MSRVEMSHVEIDGRQMLCYIAHDMPERNNIELELLRHQRRLDQLAHHDSLTGLPNRLFLRTYLEQALQACSADAVIEKGVAHARQLVLCLAHAQLERCVRDVLGR